MICGLGMGRRRLGPLEEGVTGVDEDSGGNANCTSLITLLSGFCEV